MTYKKYSLRQIASALVFSFLLTGCVSMPEEAPEKIEPEVVECPELVCPPCPEPPFGEQELVAIVQDLSRYSSMSPAERQKEQRDLIALLNSKATAKDPDRIRLAWLYALRENIQADQLALEQLGTVRKNRTTPLILREYTNILSRMIYERQKQLKKLQDLTDMESKLLQERIGAPAGSPPPTTTP